MTTYNALKNKINDATEIVKNHNLDDSNKVYNQLMFELTKEFKTPEYIKSAKKLYKKINEEFKTVLKMPDSIERNIAEYDFWIRHNLIQTIIKK